MSASDLFTEAAPLLAEIKAHNEKGRALAKQRQELAGTFSGRLPAGVARSIFEHHAVDYTATVFGLLPSEYPAELLHQIEAHAHQHASRNAVHATKHGVSK
ncbi:MAG: hypothetical protein ABW061_17905 [Polyangiaceae bacterium]